MVNPLNAVVVSRSGGPVDTNADAVGLSRNAVIVLDGATALEPVPVTPSVYADVLSRRIAVELYDDPVRPIPDAVASAIIHTARRLDLQPGASPSSTVTVLRTTDDVVDLYVLGDSPIHYGTATTHEVLGDDRLAAVAQPQHARYVERLRAGHGYDDTHRSALVALQRAQRAARNQPGGYWIAEADPDAAYHGITRTIPHDRLTWAVLATDGAADLIDHLGHSWPAIAGFDRDQLNGLLDDIHRWETDTDPNGRDLPRAKRHDDKTVVTLTCPDSFDSR